MMGCCDRLDRWIEGSQSRLIVWKGWIEVIVVDESEGCSHAVITGDGEDHAVIYRDLGMLIEFGEKKRSRRIHPL